MTLLTEKNIWDVGANDNSYGLYADLGQAYFQFSKDGKHYLANAAGKKILDLSNIQYLEQLVILKSFIDTRKA